jgi:hypothetical protein
MSHPMSHLHDELQRHKERVTVNTKHGPVTGGRADGGQAVFLGMWMRVGSKPPYLMLNA